MKHYCAPLIIGLALTGCASQAARHKRAEHHALTAGDRSHSTERRTAAARPRPWQEEKGPFEADRTGVEGYQAEHRAARDKGGVAEGPTLSRCLRVIDRYACPLLVHRWRAKDVQGGLRLEAMASAAQAEQLRDFVRCHHDFGRHDRNDQSCLRPLAPVRATGGYKKGKIFLELTTSPAKLEQLRKGVRALIAEAR